MTMFHDFEGIGNYLRSSEIKKRIALCGAHDESALTAVVDAKRGGVIDALLIGDKTGIENILASLNELASDYEIVHEAAEEKAARMAVKCVSEGKADIPMKGIMQTTSFIAALAHPIYGILTSDDLMTHATAFYYPPRSRFVFASDTSFTMNPTLEEKVQIIINAVQLAKAFGYEDVKVGVLSAIETVRDDVPSTLDARALSEMAWEDGVVVEGPFALDNALDEHAARHKGITKQVAGHADVIIVPDFLSGNVLYKSLHFFGHLPYAGVVCGTAVPAILPSRSDEPKAKYNATLAAILQSLQADKT
jgi:phosphate butyryltransferase